MWAYLLWTQCQQNLMCQISMRTTASCFVCCLQEWSAFLNEGDEREMGQWQRSPCIHWRRHSATSFSSTLRSNSASSSVTSDTVCSWSMRHLTRVQIYKSLMAPPLRNILIVKSHILESQSSADHCQMSATCAHNMSNRMVLSRACPNKGHVPRSVRDRLGYKYRKPWHGNYTKGASQ